MDFDTQLFHVTPSIRSGKVHAEIINLERVVRSCHLIPKFGSKIDSQWNQANVLDKASSFYLNKYIDFHFFKMVSQK